MRCVREDEEASGDELLSPVPETKPTSPHKASGSLCLNLCWCIYDENCVCSKNMRSYLLRKHRFNVCSVSFNRISNFLCLHVFPLCQLLYFFKMLWSWPQPCARIYFLEILHPDLSICFLFQKDYPNATKIFNEPNLGFRCSGLWPDLRFGEENIFLGGKILFLFYVLNKYNKIQTNIKKFLGATKFGGHSHEFLPVATGPGCIP